MSKLTRAAAGLGAASALTAAVSAARIPFELALVVKPADRDQHLKIPAGPAYENFRDYTQRGVAYLETKEHRLVYVQASDGAMLKGRFYEGQAGQPLDICFHGYRGTALRDFCGGGPMLLKLGHSLLLVDERGQGGSQGPCMTMGTRESEDALRWIDFSLTELDWQGPIFLYGVSMGAATVVMTAGEELPSAVKGIVADSPYSSVPEIMRSTMEKMNYPAALYRLVRLGAKIWGRVDLEEKNAAQAAGRSRIPILVIHGEADTLVPARMSEAIAAANPALVTRVLFPGAEHVLSFMADEARYVSLVCDFLDSCLKR